jgi:hypothetical protein
VQASAAALCPKADTTCGTKQLSWREIVTDVQTSLIVKRGDLRLNFLDA